MRKNLYYIKTKVYKNMSEQIKTTTVDQLPEATSLDELQVFGYSSKNAVGKRSVKVPIELLKGNKGNDGGTPIIGANGNWWINGVDTGLPARGEKGDSDLADYGKKVDEHGNKLVYAPEGKVVVEDKTPKSTISNTSQDNDNIVYATRLLARNAVAYKGKGQIIVYNLTGHPAPISEIFIGADIADWEKEDSWLEIPYIHPREDKDSPEEEEKILAPFSNIQYDAFYMNGMATYQQETNMIELSGYFANKELTKILVFAKILSGERHITIWKPTPGEGLGGWSEKERITITAPVLGDYSWVEIILPKGVVVRENERLGFGNIAIKTARKDVYGKYLGHMLRWRADWGIWNSTDFDPCIQIYGKDISQSVEDEGSVRVPTLPEISPLGLNKNFTVGNHPISFSDESGNVSFAITKEGKVLIGDMELPDSFADIVNAIVDQKLEQGSGSSGNASYTYNDRDAKIVGIGSKKFCFIHVSDTHSNMASIMEVGRIAKYYDVAVDDVIHSGDVVENYATSGEVFIDQIKRQTSLPNIMWTIGNHDCEISGDGTKQNQYDVLIKPFIEKWGIVAEEGKCYYYKDYPKYGIRVITLDIYDNVDNPSEWLAFRQMSVAQMHWFARTLETANASGMGVIVNMHDLKNETASHSGEAIKDLLLAFKNGESIDKVYNGKSGNPNLELKATFPNKGDLIMRLAGHIHADRVGSDSLGIFKVASFAGNRWNQDSLYRGSYATNNFDVVIVDRVARKVLTFRIGAAYDPEYLTNNRSYAESTLNIT